MFRGGWLTRHEREVQVVRIHGDLGSGRPTFFVFVSMKLLYIYISHLDPCMV